MRLFLYGFVAIALLLGASQAGAEIHKCEGPDGGIVFQQTPCPEPRAEESDDSEAAGENPASAPEQQERAVVGRDESVEDVVAARQEQQRLSREVEACKQQYRDAIDAIDLEIQNSYAPEQREYYLERLKALTDKMSAC